MKSKKVSLFAFQDIITSVIGIFVFISILLVLSISLEQTDLIEELENKVQFDEQKLKEKLKELNAKNNDLKKLKQAEEKNIQSVINNLEQIKHIKILIKDIDIEIEKIIEILREPRKKSNLSDIIKEQKEMLDKKIQEIQLALSKKNKTTQEYKKAIENIKEEIKRYSNAVILSIKIQSSSLSPVYVECVRNEFKLVGREEIYSYDKFKSYLSQIDKNSQYIQFLFRPSSIANHLRITEECNAHGISYGASVILENEIIINETR